MSRFVERSAVPPAPTDKSRPTPKRAPQPPRSPLSQILQLRAAQSAKTSAPAGGLPAKLKAGIEQLSGFAMDDVRVHANSPEPAKLGALAYAKGSDIHLSRGAEKHLPHEAWHVVQQKQGRVKPTLQRKGIFINDDDTLEREADAMGARAALQQPPFPARLQEARTGSAAAQLTTEQAQDYVDKHIDDKHLNLGVTYDRVKRYCADRTNSQKLRLDLAKEWNRERKDEQYIDVPAIQNEAKNDTKPAAGSAKDATKAAKKVGKAPTPAAPANSATTASAAAGAPAPKTKTPVVGTSAKEKKPAGSATPAAPKTAAPAAAAPAAADKAEEEGGWL